MKSKLLIVVAALSAVMLGQDHASSQGFVPNYAYGYGQGAWGMGFGGGTPASFETQAMADMVRAQGAFNMMSTAAMVNVEQARSQFIQNQRDWTEVYAMQQRVRQEQAAIREQARRDRVAARNARPPQPANLPTRLLSTQLDPSTGKIQWPAPLLADAFSEQRKTLESLFASRVHTGTTSDLSQAITDEVRAMRDELRRQIREMPTQDYMDARRFLDSLGHEGQVPRG